MVNAEFSRIYRFVKLLVNEGFLAVDRVNTLSPRVLKSSFSDWSKCSDTFLGH